MDRVEQINVRLSPDEIARLDKKRIDLQAELGKIPSRGEVVRMALDAFMSKRATRRQ
jgi:Arc/MetJ-type ribon-helix-helix transcriptional regulator